MSENITPKKGEGVVKSVTIEKFCGTKKTNKIQSKPTWKDLKHAIEAMNADDRSAIGLEAENGLLMAIGGGSGRYVAHVTEPEGKLFQLKYGEKLRDPELLVSLVVGGQESFVPKKYVVNLRLVLAAACFFFETGGMKADLIWEEN